MNTTERTSEGIKQFDINLYKDEGNLKNLIETFNAVRKENADLRAALAELIPIAEAGQAYYRQNPGFDWVKEREKSKSAIERAKSISDKNKKL